MEKIALADGRTLAYELSGDRTGAPVIFHHGTGDSRLARHPDPRVTSNAGVCLVTVDRPGYGGSTPLPGRHILDWPRDVFALADSLALKRFAVVGWSGGAVYALAVARASPARVSKAVLVSPIGPLYARGALSLVRKDFRLLWRLRRLTPLIRLAARSDTKRVKADPSTFVEGWVKDAPRLDRELLEQPDMRRMLEEEIVEAYRQGAVGWLSDVFALMQWGFEPSTVTTPVEVFHGDADPIVFPGMGEALAKQVGNGRFHLIPGEGHLCVFRRWQEVLRAATSAVQEIEQSRAGA